MMTNGMKAETVLRQVYIMAHKVVYFYMKFVKSHAVHLHRQFS